MRSSEFFFLHGGEFLRRAELHQNSGEGLREAVVDLLADARALDEHRRLLRRIGEARELHGERRLLRERDEQLAVLDVFGALRRKLRMKKPTLRAPNTSG